MLKPKKKIGIVYGHDHGVLEHTRRVILAQDATGYRVTPKILNEDELRTKGGPVFQTLIDFFGQLDAAVVFMTADDRGISKNEFDSLSGSGTQLSAAELASRLRPRARQNVVLELGLIIGHVGEGRYRIFAPREIELPSDIQGKFSINNLDLANITKIIHELIEKNLALTKLPFPIADPSYPLRYGDLHGTGSDVLALFAHEYDMLDNDGDRVIYLFERIVFDSYLQQPDWWQSRFRSLSTAEPKVALCRDLLEQISRYMHYWRPPQKEDYDGVFATAKRLRMLLRQAEEENFNPLIKIVSYDYLGLALHKLGIYEGLGADQREASLQDAEQAFSNCLELADRFDDPHLPLWGGYATFNLARTLCERERLAPSTEAEQRWREIFHRAIEIREGWTRSPYVLPVEIEEGLMTEYLHAKADRIQRAKTDESGALAERFPFHVDQDFIRQAELEYQQWVRDPKQVRVRLAQDVHEGWGVVRERFGKLLSGRTEVNEQ